MKFRTRGRVDVYAPNGAWIFRTHAEDAQRRLSMGHAEKLTGERGYVIAIRILPMTQHDQGPAPARCALLNLPPHTHRQSVSKKHQDPGACTWVPRPDMAASGAQGAMRTIHLRGF